MNREDFVDLVLQLDRKLATPDTPCAFDITLERFSEDCADVGRLISFLKDIYLPRVVREFTLWISSSGYPRLCLHGDSMMARYSIYNASDTTEASSIKDVIVEFRKKHGTSRLLTWTVGLFLGVGLLFLAMVEFATLAMLLTGPYRSLNFIIALCSITFLAYMTWSFFTNDPPAFSFRHTLLYMGKEPRQNVVWVLVSTILIEIVVVVLVSFIMRA